MALWITILVTLVGACRAGDEGPKIIFSSRHEIRQLNLKDMEWRSLVSGLRNTIALDFHWESKHLFWTDVIDDAIYRGNIMSNNTVTDIERIVDVGLSSSEGLAVDWVGGNIYWVEKEKESKIEVAKLNGSQRTTLLAGNMQSPRAIALDPRVGYLFWTDWDSENPRIERCSMSGENSTRKVIYNISTITNGGWPNGLTLDYKAYRVYWVDAKSDSVHTVDYNGNDHKLVLSSNGYLRHPFSITLFEDWIYWSDWRNNSLVKANKFDGSQVTEILTTLTQPFDVKIFHPLRQPKANNPCDPSTNGGCTHLCLLGHEDAIDGFSKLVARCRCPLSWKLDADNRTCIIKCDRGTFGAGCSSTCSKGCVDGECDNVNGQCTCKPGWSGDRCQAACPQGKYGVNCKDTCGEGCQLGLCDISDGKCSCQEGWKGLGCGEECTNMTYGVNCAQNCSAGCDVTCDILSVTARGDRNGEGPHCTLVILSTFLSVES